MNVQWALVAVIVAASASYAAWTLMPAALRRALAAATLRLPLPRALAARMRRHAEGSADGGCSGCARNPDAAASEVGGPATARPITIHRRMPG
jgi:hypothetical protein